MNPQRVTHQFGTHRRSSRESARSAGRTPPLYAFRATRALPLVVLGFCRRFGSACLSSTRAAENYANRASKFGCRNSRYRSCKCFSRPRVGSLPVIPDKPVAALLNPKYLQARTWYALFYLQYSQVELKEGMAQARLALASDPLSSYAAAIYALTCMDVGEIAEAVEVSRRASKSTPTIILRALVLQESLRLSGQYGVGWKITLRELALRMRCSRCGRKFCRGCGGCEAEAAWSAQESGLRTTRTLKGRA